MPERGFQSGTWSDSWVQKLDQEAKFLFIYLWTNDHCNQAGVYEISLETIAFETKLPVDSLPALLRELSPKVEWYPQNNLIWVRNFLRHQTKSPKFLVAAAKCLNSVKNNGLIQEVVAYNLVEYRISIPYPYAIDSVSIPPAATASASADPNANAKGVGVVKGEGEVIKALRGLKNWRADDEDVEWLRGFQAEFSTFDLKDIKACANYNSGQAPAKHKGVWRNRLRNWMVKEREIEQERGKEGAQSKGRSDKGLHGAEAFRGEW